MRVAAGERGVGECWVPGVTWTGWRDSLVVAVVAVVTSTELRGSWRAAVGSLAAWRGSSAAAAVAAPVGMASTG